ncbi:MAG: hypothetical protein ACRDKT_13555, partial [Actinomycetota bacterium]
MSDDLDRLLKDSLSRAGDEYEAGQRERRPEARAEFIRRYHRRRWVFPTVVSVGAAAAVAAVVVIGASVIGGSGSPGLPRPDDDVEPIRPAGRPAFELTVPLEGTPVDLAPSHGSMWVANASEGSVVRLNSNTAELEGIVELGGTPSVISPGPNYVWVGEPASGTIAAIDPATNELIRGPFEVGDPDAQMVVSVGVEHVWVVLNNRLFFVDDETGEATVVDEVDNAVDVTARSGPVWVLDRRQGLLRFDGSTGQSIADPIDVAVQDGDVFAVGDTIWLGDREDDDLLAVDANTGTFKGTIEVPGSYVDAAFGPNAAWVLSRSGDVTEVTTFNIQTGRSVGSPFRLAGDATELAISRGAVWA